MICTCERCLYTFETAFQPEQCPDCGKFAVRAATTREVGEYRRIRQELARDEQSSPWYRQASPSRLAYGL